MTRAIQHIIHFDFFVAYQFNKYAMVSAPVINQKNEIIGSDFKTIYKRLGIKTSIEDEKDLF